MLELYYNFKMIKYYFKLLLEFQLYLNTVTVVQYLQNCQSIDFVGRGNYSSYKI